MSTWYFHGKYSYNPSPTYLGYRSLFVKVLIIIAIRRSDLSFSHKPQCWICMFPLWLLSIQWGFQQVQWVWPPDVTLCACAGGGDVTGYVQTCSVVHLRVSPLLGPQIPEGLEPSFHVIWLQIAGFWGDFWELVVEYFDLYASLMS